MARSSTRTPAKKARKTTAKRKSATRRQRSRASPADGQTPSGSAGDNIPSSASSDSHNSGSMTAPESGIKVRMYRQGHGDCFLLAMRGKEGETVRVLIDCGFKPGSNGPDYGLPTFEEVLDDLKVATGKKIDLVIVTHEHQDHVNGFWRKNEPYFDDFEIKNVWFAWTESPDDELAKELRKRHRDQLLGLMAAFNRLSADGSSGTLRLQSLLEVELGEENLHGFGVKNPENSVNKQGMRLLKEKAGKRNIKYINPEETEILEPPGVEGVRVFALGPPYSAKLLADEDPKGDEAFPGMAAAPNTSFSAAARAAVGLEKDQSPFSLRFSIPLAQAASHTVWGDFFKEFYAPATPTAGGGAIEGANVASTAIESTVIGDEVGSNEHWRRIDNDWLQSADELAIALNKGINNTSLVLAFELANTRKVLLFAADAQRGNWLSWTKYAWEDDDKKITARDLLSRTVLYKVGHHGSHNATLNGTTESEHANLSWMGRDKFGAELTAMITAVEKWALKKQTPPWRHPLPSIWEALLEKCDGRVFRTDQNPLEAAPAEPDRAWRSFASRSRADANNLYYEHVVLDEWS